MIKPVGATLLHIQLDVATGKAFEFYKRMFAALNLRTVDEGVDYLGVTDERIMLILRRRVGLVLGGGRIGFRVESRVAVDKFLATFLATEMITPLAWPDESSEDAGRYYAVTFETPDATRVEIAWVPL